MTAATSAAKVASEAASAADQAASVVTEGDNANGENVIVRNVVASDGQDGAPYESTGTTAGTGAVTGAGTTLGSTSGQATPLSLPYANGQRITGLHGVSISTDEEKPTNGTGETGETDLSKAAMAAEISASLLALALGAWFGLRKKND
ncbi:hypothetical protein [Weissella confusa]|nr:hypothetical protein [Weissella confusa]